MILSVRSPKPSSQGQCHPLKDAYRGTGPLFPLPFTTVSAVMVIIHTFFCHNHDLLFLSGICSLIPLLTCLRL